MFRVRLSSPEPCGRQGCACGVTEKWGYDGDMKTTVAAIDFGTSKIVTLVAENSGTQRCDIIGAGIAAYDGYLEDGWNNPGALNEAIMASVEDAEKQSRRKIHDINVGVPGAFTKVYATEARIALKGTDPRVTAADVRAAFKAAESNLGEHMGVVVHSSPAWFSLDDGKRTLEPVGQPGRELSALISFVVADKFFTDEVLTRLTGLGYNVTGFYSSAAGEAMLFLPEEERDRTCVLIDMGYLNTDVMIVEGDALTYLHTIDVGGGNIAADLAIGLDIPLKDAEEKIKRQYTYGIDTPGETYELLGVDGQKPRTFTREEVSEIITPRVEEIAEDIQKSLDDSGIHLGNWSNIYLTGGGLSFNRGGRDFLSSKLGRPVRDTPKRTAKLNSHAYSSALGLMDLIIDTIEQRNRQSASSGGAVKEFFRSLLGG